jgi:superfamily I DNA/RNA helicase
MKKDWMIKESELDDDQIKVLMAALNKSCIVEGCAGSGKSVLALIKAQRIQKERGNNYKIIVFTKALCNYMNSGRQELGLTNDFYYYEEWKYQRENRGGYMVYSRDEHGEKIPYMPTADYIIVDEIQDFTKEEIEEFINATKKNFFFFGDTAQSIFDGLKEGGTLPVDQIKIKIPQALEAKSFPLYRNYRLPIPVAKVAQSIGIDTEYVEGTYKSNEQSVPRIIKYDNVQSQVVAIKRIIQTQNLTDVGILLPHNDDVKNIYDALNELGGNYEARYNDKEDWHNSKDTLNFRSTNPKIMTYHSAKGLQFESIILPMLEDYDEEHGESDRKALYVAMTRTYRNLYIMYSGSLPDVIRNNVDSSLYKTTEMDTIEDI